MNNNAVLENYELRANARAQLKGVWGTAVLAFFILFLIDLPFNVTTVIDSLYTFNEQFSMGLDIPDVSGINTLFMIIFIVIGGPFALGFAGFFLKRIRGEDFSVNNIFDGFNRFLPAFLLMIFSSIFVFLWAMLLIIPGIVKMYGYSMAFYILNDNPGMNPLEALKKSEAMMNGYKKKLFLLQLSFFGWAFLCAFAWIGFLWLQPYVQLSIANFYENLKKSSAESQPLIQNETKELEQAL